jgi:hypothetical protein
LHVRFTGRHVPIRYRTGLHDAYGNEAHATTYVRKRIILLDKGLRRNKSEHRRILLHEMFHFAWVRLGNPKRWGWESMLEKEWRAKVRGECGWSAEWRKRLLNQTAVKLRTHAWREYCCESFCDTAAWVYGGSEVELTLPVRYRRRRRNWFRKEFATGCVAI